MFNTLAGQTQDNIEPDSGSDLPQRVEGPIETSDLCGVSTII